MKLYSYFRSSAAYRVRIALNLKGLDAEIIPVHLLKKDQHRHAYRQLHPTGLVPTWVEHDDQGEFVLTQSLSILEYLEERYAGTALLPQDLKQRALIRAFSHSIACDIHPLNNLRVLQYLKAPLACTEIQRNSWYQHWISVGLKGLELQLQDSNAQFCFGDAASLADCCLIPQIYNAKRFNIDLTDYPKIESIYAHCNRLSAFQNAAPDAQQDAE